MKYIWQQADFPKFKYDTAKLLPLVEESVVLIGEVRGIMKGFSPNEGENEIRYYQIELNYRIKKEQLDKLLLNN